MPPYGIDSLLNRNFDTQGYFESPVESIYDPAFGSLNYQTAYSPAPYTGNIPLTSYRVQPGIENLSFQGDLELPFFGGSGNPRFNQFGKDIDFINAPQDTYPAAVPPDFINAPQGYYQPDLTSVRGLDMNKFKGVGDMSVIDETTNDEQDQNYIDAVNQNKESGIMKLIKFLIPGSSLGEFLPKSDPRAVGIRNFYRPYEGLTSTGSIASGIMKGYNPVSGGFLNMITGGKFGKPTNYGLAGAMQRRIENIIGRKAPQTDASRARIAELRNLQLAEMTDRSDRGESLSDIGRSTFSGPGMSFAKQSGGVSGKGTANERNYGGR